MKIQDTIKEILLEQRILDDIRAKYVGDGDKKIPEKVYQDIVRISENKVAYIVWLVKMSANGIIKIEDLYKYDEYLKIFTKYKNLYKEKDINKYNSSEDLNYFLRTTIGIREKDVVADDAQKNNYVSVNDIKKLNDVGILYHGMSEGYQVFEVPNSVKDSKEAWKVYSNILGKCAGRDSGAKIDICTIASFEHFQVYLERYPESSYFVMFNLSDKQSPYQFHYESGQYMDKNDNKII